MPSRYVAPVGAPSPHHRVGQQQLDTSAMSMTVHKPVETHPGSATCVATARQVDELMRFLQPSVTVAGMMGEILGCYRYAHAAEQVI
jgi:hypothetical protein